MFSPQGLMKENRSSLAFWNIRRKGPPGSLSKQKTKSVRERLRR